MNDMRAVGSVLGLATEVKVPWLLVHGTEDTVVPCSESREIVQANPAATLVELDGAGHLFSGEHEPQMAQAVVDWLRAQRA